MLIIKRINEFVAGPNGDKWIALCCVAFVVGLGLGHLHYLIFG